MRFSCLSRLRVAAAGRLASQSPSAARVQLITSKYAGCSSVAVDAESGASYDLSSSAFPQSDAYRPPLTNHPALRNEATGAVVGAAGRSAVQPRTGQRRSENPGTARCWVRSAGAHLPSACGRLARSCGWLARPGRAASRPLTTRASERARPSGARTACRLTSCHRPATGRGSPRCQAVSACGGRDGVEHRLPPGPCHTCGDQSGMACIARRRSTHRRRGAAIAMSTRDGAVRFGVQTTPG